MRAYKGFHKDLNCTMGKGVFYYEPGKWYSEQEARCADTGFHATDNPLEVLRWYSGEDDRYFAVELRGNIDEDGYGSRIAAPEIMLVKELTIDDLYRLGVLWMSKHPKSELAAAVTDWSILPPEGSPLKRNLWQLGKEQENLFRKLWEICNKGQYPRSASIMDALIPQGDAVYTVRIPGERRTQIIINSDGATVINLKTLERSKYIPQDICYEVEELLNGGSSPEEQYKMLYGEDLIPEEPEIAPVQPNETPKEKKPEKRKESRVTKANTEKKKPKEPEKKPEQMTIPGAAPDPAPEEPQTQVNDSPSGETDADDQVPGQTDLENDFPQYCPSEGDQRTAYRQSIRGSVENLVRYVEMDLIVAARQQLSDISGYLDRLEELSKGGGQNVEDVETGESEGV